LGAIERGGYQFEPEFSVINQNGAIHVYHEGVFIDEIKFTFHGEFPVLNNLEQIVDDYCRKRLNI